MKEKISALKVLMLDPLDLAFYSPVYPNKPMRIGEQYIAGCSYQNHVVMATDGGIFKTGLSPDSKFAIRIYEEMGYRNLGYHSSCPEDNCLCGFHSTRDMDVINGFYLDLHHPIVSFTTINQEHLRTVLCLVELSGKIIEHEKGFRSQYMEIASIVEDWYPEPKALPTIPIINLPSCKLSEIK